jgi:hypothetical protein
MQVSRLICRAAYHAGDLCEQLMHFVVARVDLTHLAEALTRSFEESKLG